MDVHPRLELGKAALQAADSTLCLVHDALKLVPSAGSAPAPLRSQRRMLLLHYEGTLKWVLRWDSRPHGPVYKTGAFLCRPRRSVSVIGAVCRFCPGAICLEDRNATATSIPLNWSLELGARQPLRIFNPPFICLSHPALGIGCRGRSCTGIACV